MGSALKKTFPDPLESARILLSAGRLPEALSELDSLVECHPGQIEAWVQRSLALIMLARYNEALTSAERALALSPAHPNAQSYRGSALLQLGRADEALAAYDRVISLVPKAAVAHYNRANALQRLGRWQDALPSLNQALKLQPVYPDAWTLVGLSAQALGEYDQAIHCYDNALRIDPECAAAHYNKGLLLLAMGRLGEGWDNYAWRLMWEITIRQSQSRSIGRVAPDWHGEPLDQPLLVIPEQGLGDQIFYSGMLTDLAEQMPGSTVCIEPRLQKLLARSFPALDIVTPDQINNDRCSSAARFGAQIHIGSLGNFYRRDESDFSRITSGYLKPDADHAAEFISRLGNERNLRCGLSWISKNAEHGRDKSLSLEMMLPILLLPHIDFIDLQYGDTAAERHMLRAVHGIDVRKMDDIDNFHDIDGLAALISACDIVVTVSNTTAHLAAALGKPVLILLPSTSALFWYWHFERVASPWYPTAVLLRQGKPGDWSEVISTAKAAVEEFSGARRQ